MQGTRRCSPSSATLHKLGSRCVEQRHAQVLAGLSATPDQVRLSATYCKDIASAERLLKPPYWTHYVLLNLTHVAYFAENMFYRTLLARNGEYRAPPSASADFKLHHEGP